jgi:hypothetical protein
MERTITNGTNNQRSIIPRTRLSRLHPTTFKPHKATKYSGDRLDPAFPTSTHFNQNTNQNTLISNTIASSNRLGVKDAYRPKRELNFIRNSSLPCTYCFPVSADFHLPNAVTSASVQPATTAAVAEPLFTECVEYLVGSKPTASMRSLQLLCSAE